MPATQSAAPTNHSGLQWKSQPSKRKRSITDEQARKRLKDEINTEIGDEEGEQKMKGGRGGKKAKGRKKEKYLRYVLTLPFLRYCTN